MTDWKMPSEAQLLLQGPIPTLAHLEVLLALRRTAPAACTPRSLAEAARLPPGAVVRRCVDALVRAGLAVPLADVDAYRYEPLSDELRGRVDVLARTYGNRPSAIVRALYRRAA